MTILLVDGNNILARSHHAAMSSRARMSVDGVSTSTLVIFINLLSKYVRLTKPERMSVYWDMGHQARDRIDPSYKANRKKHVEAPEEEQTPWRQAREFLTWAGVPHLGWAGFEADDLIAIAATNNRRQPDPEDCFILSGDKDLLQLVGPRTSQIRPGGSGSEIWDTERVRSELGLEPEHFAMYLALVGDSVDNIKGVPGIGPKKALKALEEADWTWDTLMEALGEEKAAMARTARLLVDLRNPVWMAFYHDPRSVPPPQVPEFHPTTPQGVAWEPLAEFLDRWQMNSVRQRLLDGSLWYQEMNDEPPKTDGSVFEGIV